MNILLNSCTLCPRNCKVNRNNNQLGFCGMTKDIVVARAGLHFWEEPIISGEKGSGTVFFSGCNLKCAFCQNFNISTNNFGKTVSINRLSKIFLELQEQGAHNINLVTPTHFVPQIIEALKISKRNGLNIPIVYNSSGYENVDTIKLLDGYIDIYLPDFKYFDNKFATKYSKCTNYFEHTSKALEEMIKQVGNPIFDENGMLSKGVIVRHMLIPGLLNDSKKIISYLVENYNDNIFISIMNQYTPTNNLNRYPEINKIVDKSDYEELIDYAIDIGIKNGFMQEGETQKTSFIPEFDTSGV
ncbi:MAG: radical SAM protein [Bacilli bacterium]|nr:radical SAM protein [Bacilli bacterium]